MGDGYWSNGCRTDVWYYGYPGSGAYYYSRFYNWQPIWVGGGVFQKFAMEGYECQYMGPPCKPYGWISEANNYQGAYGQWFVGGYIAYYNGAWRAAYGNWGQTGGITLTGELITGDPVHFDPHPLAEFPPDPPKNAPPVPPRVDDGRQRQDDADEVPTP